MVASTAGNDMPDEEDIDHDWDYDYEYTEDEIYEWKQSARFNKLHATRELTGINTGISVTICGLQSVAEYIDPSIIQIKCKNCKRKLNGK